MKDVSMSYSEFGLMEFKKRAISVSQNFDPVLSA